MESVRFCAHQADHSAKAAKEAGAARNDGFLALPQTPFGMFAKTK